MAFIVRGGDAATEAIRRIVCIGLLSSLAIAVLSACNGGAPPFITELPTNTPALKNSPKSPPPATPTYSPNLGFGPGTYQVGSDIQPGLHAGRAGTGVRDSCYWARLSGVSGELSDLVANDNAVGQFYIEILPTDKYLTVACNITPINQWPEPVEPLSNIEPGVYLIGRDIVPGTYRGEAGTGARDSCYWARLSGVSGEFSDLIANDNAVGQYFVSVDDSDFALSTSCALELVTRVPSATSTPEPAPTQSSIATPTSSPNLSFGPGTYQVSSDIQPGLYAGRAGTGVLGSCYWARLSGVSGEFSDLIANDNAVGQFYIEILPTDKYLAVACNITPINQWPEPVEPLSNIEPGVYLIGRDIVPGTYRGEAGTGARDSCYWARLSGVSGEFSDLIANDNAVGQYFVSVDDSDFALSTSCALELVTQ